MAMLFSIRQMHRRSFFQWRQPSLNPLADFALSILRLTLVFMSCLFLASCGTKSQSKEGQSKEEVKELLESFCDRLRSSSARHHDSYPALLALIEGRPVAELTALYRDRDPAVMDLYRHFGVVCQYVDSKHFLSVFISDLDDPDPVIRHFVCDALGELGQKEAIPLLKPLLDDDAVVPGWAEPVNASAAIPLSWLGSPAGFPVMFERAERYPRYSGGVCAHFRRFSDKDFGTDLEAWKKHFAVNAPIPPENEPYRWRDMVGEGPGITAYEFGSD